MSSDLLRIWKQALCRHDWQRSRYVNIQTGENLGVLCVKCMKWKP